MREEKSQEEILVEKIVAVAGRIQKVMFGEEDHSAYLTASKFFRNIGGEGVIFSFEKPEIWEIRGFRPTGNMFFIIPTHSGIDPEADSVGKNYILTTDGQARGGPKLSNEPNILEQDDYEVIENMVHKVETGEYQEELQANQ